MLPERFQIELELGKLIEDYEEWLETPNTQLDMKKPKFLITRGEFAPLWKMIYNIKKACV